ncbi:MAG: tetratricopeptide repeat protein, partial [Sedimentisphaerales bacterium]|nr:tetratricopeptide repeat protein [Sedimentisphaerales bacterium]
CFIGDTYLRAGDANTANTLYTDVLKKWPDDPQTIFAKAGQAKIYAHLALYEDSNEVIDEIFTDYTDNPSIAEAIFGIGDDYLTLGNTERRKTYIEQKLGDGFIYNMPGLSKEARNLYSKAKDVFEKLVDKQYDSVYTGQAEFWVGEAYNTLGLYQEAIQTYTTFVDKWPNFEISWIAQDRIIKIYYRMLLIDKNMTESESDEMLLNAYKKLVDRFPDCPIAEEAKRSVESYTKEIQQKGELK